MADEPEDEELGQIVVAEPSEPDYYEVEGGYIIFPHGAQWFAETYDAAAIRIKMKAPGDIEVMDVVSGAWRKPSQGKKSPAPTPIKGEKP